MADHLYTRVLTAGNWDIDITKLAREIAIALPGEAFTVNVVNPADATEVKVSFPSAVSNEGTLDTAVSDHKAAFNPVNAQKRGRKREINGRTRELLDDGVDVGGGDIISASPRAQANMERQHRNRGNASIVTYTLRFPFVDDSGYHSVAGAPALDTLYTTYMAAVQLVIKGGYDLKRDIEDASTQVALDAVVDSR